MRDHTVEPPVHRCPGCGHTAVSEQDLSWCCYCGKAMTMVLGARCYLPAAYDLSASDRNMSDMPQHARAHR